MATGKQTSASAKSGPRLVQATVEQLKRLILDSPPGTQIGSLRELSERLSVGIVTMQQASRILEHEGLLQVRRGPGGGYFGIRPDDAALERSFGSYLSIHGGAHREVFEMMTLLDTELMPAAARCKDENLRADLRGLQAQLQQCDGGADRIAIEERLHTTIFRMVERPLFELLARVTAHVSRTHNAPTQFPAPGGVEAWVKVRLRMIEAILDGDEVLAKFEAVRYREALLSALDACGSDAASANPTHIPG